MSLFFVFLFMITPSSGDWPCAGDAARFCEDGYPKVARYYVSASDEFREAITAAYQEVDPSRAHPEWERELWRICWRESKCGRFGRVGKHKNDLWAARRVYKRSVERGKLHPERCEVHRARCDEGPGCSSESERTRADFLTRGGFGMMAATYVGRLEQRAGISCPAPELMDKPKYAALVAADVIATCRRWVGKRRRTCTCPEHVRLWMGAGRWGSLYNWRRRTLVERQCGVQPPLSFWEVFADAYRLGSEVLPDLTRYLRPALVQQLSAVILRALPSANESPSLARSES